MRGLRHYSSSGNRLYNCFMPDLFSVDYAGLSNDYLYTSVVQLALAQPNESNRHDYKTVWNNDAIKDVVAFANTFGGILIIGVEKNKKDNQAKLVGVVSSSELTTGIASAIATNISPTPSYDIAECHGPEDPGRRFAVVRVHNDGRLFLVTKKDISNPAWFRNSDQTIRADAAQLRMMIDRDREVATQSPSSRTDGIRRLFDDMRIGKNYSTETPNWTRSFQPQENHLKLAVLPTERRSFRLERGGEISFLRLVHRLYRRVQSTLGTGASVVAEERGGDFYEYRWYHKNLGYEGRWRITSDLGILHATQIVETGEWSLLDAVAYAILILQCTQQWWDSHRYFGDGLLYGELSVHGGVPIARGKAGEFAERFNPIGGPFRLREDVLLEYPNPKPTSWASAPVNFATMRDDIPLVVTSLMNELLRSLGHSVLWKEFAENVEIIVRGTAQQ